MIYQTGDLVYVKSKTGFLKKEILIFEIKCKVTERILEREGNGVRPCTKIKGYLIKQYGNEDAEIKLVSPNKILGGVERV